VLGFFSRLCTEGESEAQNSGLKDWERVGGSWGQEQPAAWPRFPNYGVGETVSVWLLKVCRGLWRRTVSVTFVSCVVTAEVTDIVAMESE